MIDRSRLSTFLAIATLLVPLTRSQTYTWTGEDGFWDEAANWQPQQPASPDIPNFLAAADIAHDDDINREITFRRGLTGENPTFFLDHILLGNRGAGETTFVMSEYDGVDPFIAGVIGIDPHELTATRLWVGNDGSGTVNMTGGTLNVTRGLLLGKVTNVSLPEPGLLTDRGIFQLSGGNLHLEIEGQPSEPRIDIGVDTSGFLIQTGGTIHAQDDSRHTIRLGVNTRQTGVDERVGRYELHNGTLNAWKVLIGQGFRGEFIQHGGTSSIFNLQVGDQLPSGERVATGIYELLGGSLETLGDAMTVNTNGEFRQSGGQHRTRMLTVHGEYELTSGTLLAEPSSGHGIQVSGRFDQTGGHVSLRPERHDNIFIDEGGVYDFSSGQIINADLEIAGSFFHTGGTIDLGGREIIVTPTGGWTWLGGTVTGQPTIVVIDGQAVLSGPNAVLLDIDVGLAGGSNGRYTISGDSDLLSGTIDLGIAGAGTLDVQTNGTVSTLNLNVGQVADGEGEVVLRAGALSAAALRVGEFGSGRIDVRGGQLEATVALDLHAGGEFHQSGGTTSTPTANLHGDTTLTGGTFRASEQISLAQNASLSLTGDFVLQSESLLTLDGGSLTTPQLNLNGATISARQFIANSGALTVAGGINRITAQTALNGSTITNHGVLEFYGHTALNGTLVGGTGSLANLGTMTTGFVSFDQAFTNSGTLVLDSGLFTDNVMLFANQTFTQTSSGTLVMSVLDPVSFTTFDSISFADQANLAGTFKLILQDGFDPVAGTTLTLLNFATEFSPETGVSTRVSGGFENLILPQLGHGFSWDASQLNTWGTLTIVGSPVPEPANAGLLISGMITGFMLARRRPRGNRQCNPPDHAGGGKITASPF